MSEEEKELEEKFKHSCLNYFLDGVNSFNDKAERTAYAANIILAAYVYLEDEHGEAATAAWIEQLLASPEDTQELQ